MRDNKEWYEAQLEALEEFAWEVMQDCESYEEAISGILKICNCETVFGPNPKQEVEAHFRDIWAEYVESTR